MGMARVLSGGADGLYTVKILHASHNIEFEINRLTDTLEQIGPALEDVGQRLAIAELEVDEAWIEVNGLINQMEVDGALPAADLSSLIGLHNTERSKAGKSALSGSGSLHQAAQSHATWLASNDRTGHTGAGGSTALQRAQQAGYTGSAISIGENVAAGVVPPAENAMEAWMRSSGHKANVLGGWQHIGIGYACRNSGQHRHWWVVVFGSGGPGGGSGPAVPNACEGDSGSVPQRIREAMILLAEVAAQRDILALEMAQIQARQLESEKRLQALQAIPPDPVQEAWCADLSETLAGDVGTIDIPGEGNANVIIHPGYGGAAAHNEPRDGQLFRRAGMTPPQVFLAAALLPGWQRHMPTYRVGTLTTVSQISHTGTVTLDEATSSAQGLPINATQTLADIPIDYMDCDANAFEPGDRVVVRFQGDWESATVVGFETNPRSCLEWPPVSLPIRYQTINLVSGTTIFTYTNLVFDDAQNCWSGGFGASFGYGGQISRKLWVQGTGTFLRQEVDGIRYERQGSTFYAWDEEEREWVLPSSQPAIRLSMGLDPHDNENPFWYTDQEYGLQFRYDIGHISIYDADEPFFWRSLTYPPIAYNTVPEPPCGDPSPTRGPIYGWTTFSAGNPRNPPGFQAAGNPPFDVSTHEKGITWSAVEEDMPIYSADGTVIANWLRSMGAPEQITVSQTKDSALYTKVYHLHSAELWPDINTPKTRRIWSALYRSMPPE
jgi:hypothetical protein